MIRRAFLVALPALVGGCSLWPFSHGPVTRAGGPPDALTAQCERSADDDPKVLQQRAISAGQAGYAQVEAMQALEATKREAVQRCLARHGRVGVGGGVEQPR